MVDHPSPSIHGAFIIHESPVRRLLIIHPSISHCSDVSWIIQHLSSMRLTHNPDNTIIIYNCQHTSSFNHYWSYSPFSIRSQVSSIYGNQSFSMHWLADIHMNEWTNELKSWATGWIHESSDQSTNQWIIQLGSVHEIHSTHLSFFFRTQRWMLVKHVSPKRFMLNFTPKLHHEQVRGPWPQQVADSEKSGVPPVADDHGISEWWTNSIFFGGGFKTQVKIIHNILT